MNAGMVSLNCVPYKTKEVRMKIARSVASVGLMAGLTLAGLAMAAPASAAPSATAAHQVVLNTPQSTEDNWISPKECYDGGGVVIWESSNAGYCFGGRYDFYPVFVIDA
jgi:hypothetical protein